MYLWIKKLQTSIAASNSVCSTTSAFLYLINSPVTDVWTTCAVVIFRVKVSCITSVDGLVWYNSLWLWRWLPQRLSNVSHYQQQLSCSGLRSPGRSNSTCFWCFLLLLLQWNFLLTSVDFCKQFLLNMFLQKLRQKFSSNFCCSLQSLLNVLFLLYLL